MVTSNYPESESPPPSNVDEAIADLSRRLNELERRLACSARTEGHLLRCISTMWAIRDVFAAAIGGDAEKRCSEVDRLALKLFAEKLEEMAAYDPAKAKELDVRTDEERSNAA